MQAAACSTVTLAVDRPAELVRTPPRTCDTAHKSPDAEASSVKSATPAEAQDFAQPVKWIRPGSFPAPSSACARRSASALVSDSAEAQPVAPEQATMEAKG